MKLLAHKDCSQILFYRGTYHLRVKRYRKTEGKLGTGGVVKEAKSRTGFVNNLTQVV